MAIVIGLQTTGEASYARFINKHVHGIYSEPFSLAR